MKNISPYLKEEYKRAMKKVQKGKFKNINEKFIDFDDVLRAHYLIVDYFSNEEKTVVHGVKNFNILGSALGRQTTGFGSIQKWTDPLNICATLFFGLIKNHAFHDGNKRTALLILLYQLTNYGRMIEGKQKEFENLCVKVAANKLNDFPKYKKFLKKEDPEINFISDYLRRKTRKSDKRYYSVTYHEFNSLLNNFNFSLDKPSNQYIGLYKHITKKRIFNKSIVEKRKIFQVGFPGWKKQIGMKASKEILKRANLTAENGIDAQVFYKGHDPMSAIIDKYSGPLKRLKDK